MQQALRRYVTAGVAIAGAGLIAVAPVAPSLPDIQVRAVQLTAGIEDLTDPYSELFTHTLANLKDLAQLWLADPVPFLRQILTNQIGYGQTIFEALQSGNLAEIFDAVSDVPKGIAQNFLNVIHTLTDTSVDLDISHLIGPVPQPTIGEILAVLASGEFHEFYQDLINGTIGYAVLDAGLPVALAVDALGAPYFGVTALIDSGTEFFDAVRAGDLLTAFITLLTAPATITDAFLNAQGIEVSVPLELPPLELELNGQPAGVLTLTGATADIPLGGLLAPLEHPELAATIDYSGARICTAIVFGSCIGPITLPPDDDLHATAPVEGTPIGGLIPALVNYTPQQLADAISAPVTSSWQDIAAQFLALPSYLITQLTQFIALLGPDGLLGLLGSAVGPGDFATVLGPDTPALAGVELAPNLLDGVPLDLPF